MYVLPLYRTSILVALPASSAVVRACLTTLPSVKVTHVVLVDSNSGFNGNANFMATGVSCVKYLTTSSSYFVRSLLLDQSSFDSSSYVAFCPVAYCAGNRCVFFSFKTCSFNNDFGNLLNRYVLRRSEQVVAQSVNDTGFRYCADVAFSPVASRNVFVVSCSCVFAELFEQSNYFGDFSTRDAFRQDRQCRLGIQKRYLLLSERRIFLGS